MLSCTFAERSKFIAWLVAMTLLAVPVGDARAEDVTPGHDLFTTDSSHTLFDFAVHPIAADFFGPGSDPFDGGVPANSLPLPQNPFCPPVVCVKDDLSDIDTIVERLDPATLPTVGDSATIDIEIVALSLQSIDPITVTYGGLNPELWDVHVCLSSEPQQTGQMKLRRTHADGGNFDSSLPVTPRFIFTRQSDSEQRVLDGGLSGIMYVLDALWVPWEYDNVVPLSCRSNFCASNPFIATSVSGFATQRLLPICQLGSPIPAIPKTGLMILIAALAAVGVFVISRFRRELSSRAL